MTRVRKAKLLSDDVQQPADENQHDRADQRIDESGRMERLVARRRMHRATDQSREERSGDTEDDRGDDAHVHRAWIEEPGEDADDQADDDHDDEMHIPLPTL